MSETIYDVLYWEMTNLVQHIKDVHPGHNSIPQIDKARKVRGRVRIVQVSDLRGASRHHICRKLLRHVQDCYCSGKHL